MGKVWLQPSGLSITVGSSQVVPLAEQSGAQIEAQTRIVWSRCNRTFVGRDCIIDLVPSELTSGKSRHCFRKVGPEGERLLICCDRFLVLFLILIADSQIVETL